MKLLTLAPWCVLLVACKSAPPPAPVGDADFDGVPDDEDCAPDDPSIYPGAYDAPGDGIDADCDDEDPPHPWLGEWEMVDASALYSTYPVLLPESGEGLLDIGADGQVSLDGQSSLDPTVTETPFPIPAGLVFSGHAAPQSRSDQLMLYLEGEVSVVLPGVIEYYETSYADVLCTVDGDDMSCVGTLKALDATLDSSLRFERD